MSKELYDEINEIFHSRSVAFFGASRKGGLGNLLLQAYLDSGFPNIYPINPKAAKSGDKILGLEVHADLQSIKEPIDLVILAVHPKFVEDILIQSGEKGVKAAILFSAGFGEKNEIGKEKQERIVEIARKYKFRLIGPNCMGLYCPSTGLSFFPSLPKESGTVGFISQSGSIANLLCFISSQRGIYFSKEISLGNGADLDFNDFLYYLGNDPETKVIACYLEGVKNAQKTITVIKDIIKKKPIIIWKVGRTESGRMAASSHTGSLCGNDEIWSSIFKQLGVVQVYNIRELVEMIGAFINPLSSNGNRVGIVSGPGGPAVNSADACVQAGLELANFSDESKNKLLEIMPKYGTSIRNPVDVGLQTEPVLELKVSRIIGKDPGVDMLFLYLAMIQRKQYKELLKIQKEIQKPIVIVTTFDINGSDETLSPAIKMAFPPMKPKTVPRALRQMFASGISVFSTEQMAARALFELYRRTQYLKNI
ncbi:MAG: acetate--CoA ligase family protein [Candidatus Helarchaeota archaeon]